MRRRCVVDDTAGAGAVRELQRFQSFTGTVRICHRDPATRLIVLRATRTTGNDGVDAAVLPPVAGADPRTRESRARESNDASTRDPSYPLFLSLSLFNSSRSRPRCLSLQIRDCFNFFES